MAPPIVTTLLFARGAALVITRPVGLGGSVEPNPVPYKDMTSPTRAGVVAGTTSGRPTTVPSEWTAAAYWIPEEDRVTNSPGANCRRSAEPLAVATGVATSTDTVPSESSAGAWTFICPGPTQEIAASFPLMRTLTPSREVGSAPLVISAAVQARPGAAIVARLRPKTETHSPGEIPFV